MVRTPVSVAPARAPAARRPASGSSHRWFVLLASAVLTTCATAHPLNWTRVTVGNPAVTNGELIARVEVDLANFAGGYDRYRELARAPDGLSGLDVAARRAIADLHLNSGGTLIPWEIEELVPPSDEDEFFSALPAPMTFLRLRARIPEPTGQLGFQVARSTALELPVVWRSEGTTGTDVLMLKAGAVTPLLAGAPEAPASTWTFSGRALAWRQVASLYTAQGFLHILPGGLDHILFVLGLFFGRYRLRDLLWQISAFTGAHTLTLGLATMGWITAPGRLVEPLIAASIVYLAVENWRGSQQSASWRCIVVFVCGLLHGMGFAAALAQLGLPADARLSALLAFNIGVELGQLTVIGAAFLAVGWWRRQPRYRTAVALPASILIGMTALWWTVERTVLA